MEAFLILARSEPLRLVAILVASYGVSSSLIEVCWKGQVKRAFVSVGDYSRFMGWFWTWTGVSSMAVMFLSRALLKRLGYRVAVVFTPLTMMLAGGIFFSVAIAVALHMEMAAGSMTVSAVAAYAGAFAVLTAKSAKYGVFDATKEIVFIRLSQEERQIGKAAIDVVAYRLSKSGGSFVLQAAIVAFGSLEDAGLIPVGVVFVLVVVVWLRAAIATGRFVHEAQRMENLELGHRHHHHHHHRHQHRFGGGGATATATGGRHLHHQQQARNMKFAPLGARGGGGPSHSSHSPGGRVTGGGVFAGKRSDVDDDDDS